MDNNQSMSIQARNPFANTKQEIIFTKWGSATSQPTSSISYFQNVNTSNTLMTTNNMTLIIVIIITLLIIYIK